MFTCETSGVIHLISCLKCPKQYVGQTGRMFGKRIMEHLNYIFHKKEATGTHFTSQNHNHNDFRVQVIEKKDTQHCELKAWPWRTLDKDTRHKSSHGPKQKRLT